LKTKIKNAILQSRKESEERRILMKSLTKNNRGFSLVELIVVVLIIAIIAVALAPQVIRWVENSRIASDLETRNDIEKMCQLALTNEYVFEHVKDGGYTITITKDSTGTHVSCDDASTTSDPAFWDQFFCDRWLC